MGNPMAMQTRLNLPTSRLFSPGVLVGGSLAGVLGGIFMGVAATLWSNASGMGASAPWQNIAATFYGPMAFLGAAGVTTIGVLWHLTVAGGMGVILAVLARRVKSAGKLFILGIVYGTAVWAVMTYVFVPVFDQTMAARIPMVAVMWFFLHWIYGAFTGVFIPPLRRAFEKRAQVREELREAA